MGFSCYPNVCFSFATTRTVCRPSFLSPINEDNELCKNFKCILRLTVVCAVLDRPKEVVVVQCCNGWEGDACDTRTYSRNYLKDTERCNFFPNSLMAIYDLFHMISLLTLITMHLFILLTFLYL